jgi:hypothetical protein
MCSLVKRLKKSLIRSSLLIALSFIPSGTAGSVQVCDTTVTHSLKSRIEELANIYIDQHEREWVEGKLANIALVIVEYSLQSGWTSLARNAQREWQDDL